MSEEEENEYFLFVCKFIVLKCSFYLMQIYRGCCVFGYKYILFRNKEYIINIVFIIMKKLQMFIYCCCWKVGCECVLCKNNIFKYICCVFG